MNICNIVLIIIIVILVFLILKSKSRENFETTEVDILADRALPYKATANNIKKWYKIKTKSSDNDFGFSYKFKEDSNIEYNPSDPFVDNYTVSFLINFKQLTENHSIFYGEVSQREKKYMELVLENRNTLKLIFYGGLDREDETLLLKYDFQVETFYHIAIIYDKHSDNKQSATLFLDGQTKTIKLNYPYDLRSVIFGKNSKNVNFLNGYLGQIGIFNSALDIDILCDKYGQCKDNDDKLCDPTDKKCNFIASGESQKMCNDECIKVLGCDQTNCAEICKSCEDPLQCSWKEVKPICKFIPFGRSKLSCVKNCMKNKECDYLNCDNICSNCDDDINCPWINDKKRSVNIDKEIYIDPTGKPSPPKISIMPKYKEVNISIESTYKGDYTVNKYVIFLYKTFNKEEGITIIELKPPEDKEGIPTEFSQIVTHNIKHLDPNETYSIGVRAHNSIGVGKISKIEKIKPNHKMLQTEDIDLDSLFEDNVNYINDKNMSYKYCNN
jgi:hypothetical protein